jgi:DNA relaxase NicK
MRAYQHLYIQEMHVSRLDLQVTVWNPQDGGATGVLAEQNARDFKKRGGKGNNRQIRHIADDEDGYTLYIGSRSSASFMRLYNKGAEAKDAYYTGSWRYEVETHNVVATAAAIELAMGNVSIELSIIATVATYCRERGLFVPWHASKELSVLRPLPSLETDDLRSLRWLATQVKPTVQRLLRAGYTSDIAQALGLDQD